MSAEIIVFSYSWPALLAITAFFEKNSFIVIKIYQDEQKLLEALHKNTSLPLIIDASPHRKVLLIAAVASTSRLRAVFFTARKIHLNDKVVAEFYFEEKRCITHSKLITLTRAEIETAMRVDRSPVCLSPGIMRPRMMNLLYDRQTLYKEIQDKIYHRLYLLGATPNEINTLRLLIAGFSIQKIAELKNLQIKTIYAYKSQLAQKIEHTMSSRELIRVLSVEDKNQDNECLNHLYKTRCNNERALCETCPLYHFCYDSESDKCNLPCHEGCKTGPDENPP